MTFTNSQWQEAIVATANNGGVGAVPTIVQKASGITGSGAKVVTATFGSKVTAGNSIVVAYGLGEVVDGSTIILTITDSESNTYTSATTASQSTTLYAGISYATNVPGDPATASTVTLTLTGASAANEALAVEIYELSGIIELTPAAVDQTGTGTASSGTAVTTAPISPVTPNEYAFMAISAGNGVITAGSNWTLDSGSLAPSGGNLIKFGSQSRFLSASGSITPAATLGSSVAWCAACATFKPVIADIGITQSSDNVTLLASAAQTTTQTIDNIKTPPGCKGVIICVDTTVLPGSAVSNVVTIQGKDPVSGKYFTILTGVAIVGVATNFYTAYPGATAATNVTVSFPITPTYKVVVTAGNSNSCTYSVGAIYLV